MTLALNMLVRNAAAFAPRAIASALPHVDELVVTDTGSTDGTKNAVAAFWREHAPGRRIEILSYEAGDHPEGHILDVAETYDGRLKGPFSGKVILADWCVPRKLALEATRSDFLMFLDDDDVLRDADELPKALAMMDVERYDLALVPYLYRHNDTGAVTCQHLRAAIARRARARWQGVYHEKLTTEDSERTVALDKPVAIDLCENRDPVNKVPLRGLKVTMHAYLTEMRRDGAASADTVYKLAMEAAQTMPDLALQLLGEYVGRPDVRTYSRATAYLCIGRVHESRDDFASATHAYDRALDAFPKYPEAALGLARTAFLQGRFDDAVQWSKQGFHLARLPSARLLFHNPIEREGRSRIFYALALANTGHHDEARDIWEQGRELMPAEFAGLKNLLDIKRSKAVGATP